MQAMATVCCLDRSSGQHSAQFFSSWQSWQAKFRNGMFAKCIAAWSGKYGKAIFEAALSTRLSAEHQFCFHLKDL